MARQLFEVGLAHAVKLGFNDQAVQIRRLLKEAQRAESKLEENYRTNRIALNSTQ
jgi:hypothetical protein